MALTGLLCTTATARADGAVRPGDLSSTGCTLGFVYDGTGAHAGRTYMTIAAHCVTELGQPVGVAGTDGDPVDWTGANDYEPLGHVVVSGEPLVPKEDTALVEVLPAMALRVAPGVRGHEEWPRGVAAPVDLRAGDTLAHSGWGTATFATDAGRQDREGIYRGEDDGAWQGLSPTTPGDSGSPVIHKATGSAVGTLKGKRCGEDLVYVCGSHGPTVPSTIELAARHGIGVVMRSAGAPPPSAGTGPAPPPPSPTPPRPAPAPTCSDSAPPVSALSRPGFRFRAGRLRLVGAARDSGCAGAVARVEVALARVADGRCRFLKGPRLLPPRACGRPVWTRVSGTTRWRLDTRAATPGRYRVLTRALDFAGNRETPGSPRTLRLR